jgi:transcriptional regulator with XRE-family HTH domain
MSTIALDHYELQDARAVAKALGATIRRAREERRHTREYLAKRLRMHVTTLARIETGHEHNVKLGSLMKVLRYYRLTLDVKAVV